MIKLPFSRKSNDAGGDQAWVAFSAYCREEQERRTDSGAAFDTDRFQAAVDLVVERLKEMEQEGKE
jgi:hypothetical protein